MEIICSIDALDECDRHSRNRLLNAIVGSFYDIKNASSTKTRLKILSKFSLQLVHTRISWAYSGHRVRRRMRSALTALSPPRR